MDYIATTEYINALSQWWIIWARDSIICISRENNQLSSCTYGGNLLWSTVREIITQIKYSNPKLRSQLTKILKLKSIDNNEDMEKVVLPMIMNIERKNLFINPIYNCVYQMKDDEYFSELTLLSTNRKEINNKCSHKNKLNKEVLINKILNESPEVIRSEFKNLLAKNKNILPIKQRSYRISKIHGCQDPENLL
ncbi:hypothetical protein PIROE2DRAFT_11340 [Piromyces sp. E2]|nr:hypothetical protein PIROE2DRAFT_11340 [Piromyces sp. E2]|eukprot:OUM62383.1 hypothetical protein PIROE2DRAFT_11340 [Piromyces sp. E2]